MYRQEALDQHATPEQLDQLLQVTNRRSWLPILVLAAALGVVVVWSLVGQIPLTIEGQGVLVRPQHVVSFQASGTGQILELYVSAGDRIEADEVIGRLNQPELRQQLEQAKVRLSELRSRHSRLTPLSERGRQLRDRAAEEQRRLLEQQIASATRMAELQREKADRYIAQQQQNIDRLLETTQSLETALAERYETYEELRTEGLVDENTLLGARQRLIDNQVRQADLELNAHEVELRRIEAEREYHQQLYRIEELQAQLQELDAEAAERARSYEVTDSDHELAVQQLEQEIARYQKQLESRGRIISRYTGRVIEITGTVGQYVREGERLGAIEADDPDGTLMAVAYFDVGDGKKLKPGMDVRITPTTVQRERYGSILGEIGEVSSFPVTTDAVTNVVGNHQIARELTGDRSRIQTFSVMHTDPDTPSGYRWTSGRGPSVEITPGTTVILRATTEYRRPISFVIPILRGWSGL